MLPKHYTNEKTGISYTLHSHLADIDEQARTMFDILTEQMMKREGVTEELKEQNQIEWICRMSNIQERATEIVCKELIYA